MPNPVDEALNNDLLIVLQNSPLLWEAWQGLPEAERDAVMAGWNRLIWDTIMIGASGMPQSGEHKEWPLLVEPVPDVPYLAGRIILGRKMGHIHEQIIVPNYDSKTKEVSSWNFVWRDKVLDKVLLRKITEQEHVD